MSLAATPLLHAPGWRRLWRWLFVALMAIVSGLAFMPAQAQPETLPQLDKLQHVAAFAALAALAMLSSTGRRPCTRVALPLLGYGLFIECVQAWLPSRHGDILDLLADAAGIGLGLLVLRGLRRRWPDAGPKT